MRLLLLSSWRDTRQNLRRTLSIALLIATALAASTGLRSAEVIVERELARSFIETRPAAVAIGTSNIDPEILRTVEIIDGVVAADARAYNRGRIETADGSLVPLNLKTVPDPLAPQVNTFAVRSTFADAAAVSIWVESGSFPLIGANPGDTATIEIGSRRHSAVLGEVVDEGSVAGEVELQVFAYATPAATAQLGFDPAMTEIVIAINPDADASAIREQAVAAIEASGRAIEFSLATDTPEHPHAAQMGSVIAVTRTFALLTALASIILVAQIAASVALAARRQLGMLTLIGATPVRLVARQLTLFAMPTVIGVAFGIPGGLWIGAQVGDLALGVLSVRAASLFAPPSTVALVAGAILGMLVLVVVASSWLIGVRSVAASLSVAPSDVGAAARIGSGFWAYPVRSVLRRPLRTLAVVAVLALAGAMVLSTFSLRAGWADAADSIAGRRSFDIAVSIESADTEAAIAALSAHPEVEAVEHWAIASIPTATNPDELVGDEASLLALDPNTSVAQIDIVTGQWLTPGAANEVVLDEELAAITKAVVGEMLSMEVRGRPLDFEVVGITRTNGASNIREAFVDLTQLETRLDVDSLDSILYVNTNDRNGSALRTEERERIASDLDLGLSSAGIYVSDVQTIDEQRDLIANHILPLVAILLSLGIMAAAIASIGVAIAGEINIQERRREIAVLRLLGASTDRLAGLLAAEAVIVSAVAAFIATPLGLVIAGVLAGPIGEALLGWPVPVAIGIVPSALWLVASAFLAALAMTLGTRALIEKPLTTEITL